jgi:hypothetical protein
LSRNTIKAAARSTKPPSYRRAPAGSKLDRFKDEIHRLLKREPEMPGQRVRELQAKLVSAGDRRTSLSIHVGPGRQRRRLGLSPNAAPG